MAAFIAPAIGGIVSAFTGGCGPSAEEKQQMTMQTSMESDLMSAFNQRLGEQKDTINQLSTALSNAAAGKFPPGMDPTTLASFTSKAMVTTSRAYQNAAQAAGNAIAARGDGTADPSGVLSGPEAQIFGDIAAKGAAQESDLLMQVQYEDWQAGREDYMGYIKGLETMAELQDPAKMAGAMIESTKSPTQLSEEMTKQQSQAASDIGVAATNVAAGLGAMISQQQAKGQMQKQITGVLDWSQQQTNKLMTTPLMTMPIPPVPPSDEYASIG